MKSSLGIQQLILGLELCRGLDSITGAGVVVGAKKKDSAVLREIMLIE